MTWRQAQTQFAARKALPEERGLRGVVLWSGCPQTVCGAYLGRDGAAVVEWLPNAPIGALAAEALPLLRETLTGTNPHLSLERLCPPLFVALADQHVVAQSERTAAGVPWTRFLNVATFGPRPTWPVVHHLIAYGLGMDTAVDRGALRGAW